ncbi:ABC transporter permease [Nocardia elegans]|uniref:ABC transporter permease n=1 Tax=Nocardia elegans TaxID=300029 RepID=A0ABW6TKT8_9NOCA|nr:ABC transporter permease [Nocardia elegans]MBF6450685.1 ABC transporter permease [Nocardia elegans]
MSLHQLRHMAGHLLTPLLMCLGMGLAYLGASHQPEPNHVQVAIVGDSPEVKVMAQTLKDRAGDALEVVTLANRADAVDRLQHRDLAGAFVPDGQSPELLVAKANSDTTAMAVETVFGAVTAQQNLPLRTTDIAPTASGDPTGQGLFFVLVALSIGAYGSVAAISVAGAGTRMAVRALTAVATSFVVSVIGIVLAGPVFHVVDHDYASIWAMGWLYAAGILFIGIGLHPFLKRWTTLAVMVLFVMLNFTTSGGIYRPELQNGFFGALHSFWNGAGFVEGARSLLYFDGNGGLGGRIASLALWFAAGVVLVLVGGVYERRRTAAQSTAHVPAHAATPGAAHSTVPATSGFPVEAHHPGASAAENAAAGGDVDEDSDAEEEIEQAVGV